MGNFKDSLVRGSLWVKNKIFAREINTDSLVSKDITNSNKLTTKDTITDKLGVKVAAPVEAVDIDGNVKIRKANSVKFGGITVSDSKFEIKYNESTQSLDINKL